MLIKCKLYGNELYCYDKGIAYTFLRQAKELKECPESVIKAFITEDFDAEIIIKDDKS